LSENVKKNLIRKSHKKFQDRYNVTLPLTIRKNETDRIYKFRKIYLGLPLSSWKVNEFRLGHEWSHFLHFPIFPENQLILRILTKAVGFPTSIDAIIMDIIANKKMIQTSFKFTEGIKEFYQNQFSTFYQMALKKFDKDSIKIKGFKLIKDMDNISLGNPPNNDFVLKIHRTLFSGLSIEYRLEKTIRLLEAYFQNPKSFGTPEKDQENSGEKTPQKENSNQQGDKKDNQQQQGQPSNQQQGQPSNQQQGQPSNQQQQGNQQGNQQQQGQPSNQQGEIFSKSSLTSEKSTIEDKTGQKGQGEIKSKVEKNNVSGTAEEESELTSQKSPQYKMSEEEFQKQLKELMDSDIGNGDFTEDLKTEEVGKMYDFLKKNFPEKSDEELERLIMDALKELFDESKNQKGGKKAGGSNRFWNPKTQAIQEELKIRRRKNKGLRKAIDIISTLSGNRGAMPLIPDIWRDSDPISKLDVVRTLQSSGKIIGGVTTKKLKPIKLDALPMTGHGNIEILIDISGSTSGNVLERELEAAMGLVETAKYFKDTVSLITFGSHANCKKDHKVSTRYDELIDYLASLDSGGGTSITHAIKLTCENVEYAGRSTIFVFTDCAIYDISSPQVQKMIQSLKENRCKIVFFIIDDWGNMDVEDKSLRYLKDELHVDTIKVFHEIGEDFAWQACQEMF